MDIMFYWDWFRSRRYTHAEVRDLIERIKEYNSGVTDNHLSRYVEQTFEEWKQETI